MPRETKQVESVAQTQLPTSFMASEAAFIGNAAFSAAPSDLRIVHPLSASPASSAFFTPHPHQSCSPPPAQPQPQQHQQQQTNGNANPAEDVTTIFVVGFPEDMQEREFQNMFTFSPGFEAASLKWHCKDQDDENMTGNNSIASGGAKKQMVFSQVTFGWVVPGVSCNTVLDWFC